MFSNNDKYHKHVENNNKQIYTLFDMLHSKCF